jgi:myo-inositol-1(or 4)-monophosphatase
LWLDGPVIGVVYDFLRNEMFSAIAGEPAQLNGEDIHVSVVADKSQSIALTGFPAKLAEDAESLSTFISQIQGCKKVRLLGSAALSLAYVASGRGDIYHEKNIRIRDVASGIAQVKSAGGRYEMSGTDLLSVYADNGSLS